MRDSFIFYGSFYEAIVDLPDEERLKCYDMICEYALTNKIPDATGIAKSIFTLVRPNIDASIKRRKNGSKGGKRTKKNKCTYTNDGSVLTDYFGDTSDNYESDKEREREMDVERDVDAERDADLDADADADNTPLNPPKGKRETQEQIFDRLIVDQNIGPAMEEKIREWLKYKAEKRDGYKEQGMKSLLGKIMKAVYEHGETAVMDAIDTSMASGWRGLFFDRITARGQPQDRMQQTTDMIDRWAIAREEYERRNNDTG